MGIEFVIYECSKYCLIRMYMDIGNCQSDTYRLCT